MTAYTADVLVYGGTLTAMAAAVGAAQAGRKVIMVAPTKHLGGVVTSGLLNWDYGTSDAKYRGAWIGAEFFTRLRMLYGSKNTAYRGLARHVNYVCWEMLKDYGVYVLTEHVVTTVTKPGTTITQVTFTDADAATHTVSPVGASMNVIEAGYEADLGRMAGVTFVIGREAQSAREPNAGFGHFLQLSTIPTTYKADHVTLLNWFKDYPVGALEGEGDGDFANIGGTANIPAVIQPTFFRLPLARRSDLFGSVWKKPANYDTEIFKAVTQNPDSLTFNISSPATQGVFEYNGDLPAEWAVEWAQGTWATRGHGPSGAVPGSTWQKMYDYQAGYFWFLANDPSVPYPVRKLASQWGPVADEFQDNSSWPREPYIREGHRMVADTIIDQKYVNDGGATAADAISVASYAIDIHICTKWSVADGQFYADNGFNGMPNISAPGPTPPRSARLTHPYQIPWSAVISKASECINFASAWNDSTSHIAWGSNRMEPQGIYKGSAIGYICGRSIALATPMHSMNIPNMQTEMLALGHVIVPPA